MKFKSALLTEASGSIGGIVFSHNKGGLYCRARTIPTNPASSFQAAVRQYMNQYANRWVDKLTPAQRRDWKAYAANVTIPNVLGAQIHIGPNAHYIRCAVARKMLGLTALDDAPTAFDLGWFSAVSIVVSAATQTASLTFEPTDEWASEVGGAMGVYLSRAVSPAIDFFKGPYRYAGKVVGATPTPPTSPASIPMPFPVNVGQQVFAKVSVTRLDGRLSLPFCCGVLCTT